MQPASSLMAQPHSQLSIKILRAQRILKNSVRLVKKNVCKQAALQNAVQRMIFLIKPGFTTLLFNFNSPSLCREGFFMKYILWFFFCLASASEVCAQEL